MIWFWRLRFKLDNTPMVAEDLNNITSDMDNSAWLLKYAYFLIYKDFRKSMLEHYFPERLDAISVSNRF